MTEKLVLRCLPALSKKSAANAVAQITRLAIDRMEMTGDARDSIVASTQNEVFKDIVNDAVGEVIARQEAEKRRLEAEQEDA